MTAKTALTHSVARLKKSVIITVAGICSKFNMTIVDRLSVHELNSEHCAV